MQWLSDDEYVLANVTELDPAPAGRKLERPRPEEVPESYFDLITASSEGNVANVRSLLRGGAMEWNVTGKGPKYYHSSPLHEAAKNGHVNVVQVLILYKLDVNAQVTAQVDS